MSQPKITVSQLDAGTGPSALVIHSDLYPLGSGRIEHSHYTQIAPASGTSIIPYDNTTPLSTEGTLIATISHLDIVSAPSTVRVDFCCSVTAGTNNTTVILAVFRNDVCISAAPISIDAIGKLKSFSLGYDDVPGAVGSLVYTLRVGSDAGQTWYINSNPTGDTLGGAWVSSFGAEAMA